MDCRLAHERVVQTNGIVQRYSLGGDESETMRLGLCSPEVRGKRIGCAHTTARYRLADALEALTRAGHLQASEAARLQEKLRQVSDAISFLDHRKGALEKQYALACEQLHLTSQESFATRRAFSEQIAAMKSDLRDMENTHGCHVQEVSALHHIVLVHLESLAGSVSPVCGSATSSISPPHR